MVAGASHRLDPPRRVAVALGLLHAFSGAVHGAFEVLQVAKPVVGMTREAIGPDHRNWLHGNEPAFPLALAALAARAAQTSGPISGATPGSR